MSSLIALWRLTLCSDFAKETVGMRLVAAPRVEIGEFEETSGERARLVDAANEAQGLTQLGEHGGMEIV
jgi:hypothetical protein